MPMMPWSARPEVPMVMMPRACDPPAGCRMGLLMRLTLWVYGVQHPGKVLSRDLAFGSCPGCREPVWIWTASEPAVAFDAGCPADPRGTVRAHGCWMGRMLAGRSPGSAGWAEGRGDRPPITSR